MCFLYFATVIDLPWFCGILPKKQSSTKKRSQQTNNVVFEIVICKTAHKSLAFFWMSRGSKKKKWFKGEKLYKSFCPILFGMSTTAISRFSWIKDKR